MLATAALAMDCGGHGTFAENCCKCDAGYAGSTCMECAPGYAKGMVNGEMMCGNGRDGTACTDDGMFPFFGCGSVGTCKDSNTSSKTFPCVCRDLQGTVVSCATKYVEKQTTCSPRGARMYTAFPNEPRLDLPFSLTVVTCGETSPSLMMVPAYKEDGVTMNSCSNRTGETGGFAAECVMPSNGEGNATVSVNCRDGVVLTNLNAELSTRDMAEFTYSGMIVTKDNFFVSSQENPANRNKFKVCASRVVPVAAGSSQMETIWVPVDGHNDDVSRRDEDFTIVSEDDANKNRAAGNLEGVGGDDCCDGLKIGFCLPLWAFLLLWLLMALCLGFLGFALHKNKNEIEAKKNNEKYEKFNTDAEMIEHAAKEADDDDI